MFTLFQADCLGQAANCLYPNKVEVTDAESLEKAVSRDYVCAEYENSYRSNQNFRGSDCLSVECDNDHSDNPADWKTPDDIADVFPGVEFAVHYSRNHMKVKNGRAPRPKFTVDFLTKKKKVNQGEIPQYYVENSHEAIVTALEFDMVQGEIARRQKLGQTYSGNSIFSSKLICGDCGGFYGQKVWHSNDAYRRVVWQCNKKFTSKERCGTPTLAPEAIQRMYLQAYNQLMGSRDELLASCEVMRQTVANCDALNAEIDALNEEIHVVAELVNQCVKENATKSQSQDEYLAKYNRLVRRYEKAVDKLNADIAEKDSKLQRERELRIFIAELAKQPLVATEWSEELWISLLDTATVHKDTHITFRFRDGTEIDISVD